MQEKWFPGHMMKAYKRLKETINIIDVLVDVRDARAPVSSGNNVLEHLTQTKKVILVLNKEDLADPQATHKWLRYFYPGRDVFAVNSITKHGIKPIFSCFQRLLEEKKILLQAKGRKDVRLRILVVGIPNVGKSAFINSLSKRGKVKVGRKAGLTRGEQWINISEGLELLDTPGILPFSKKEEVYWKLAIIGSLDRDKIEHLNVLEKLYKTCPSDSLWMELPDLYTFLENKGQDYGFLMTGGKVDIEKTAKRFLQELETGKAKRFLTLELLEEF
ncbi:MAG TPA: ribosome biogenesis GTPase YlqF [Candidatus Eremiobacteraeota bacterium]|nr:MAG: Ribosome biogenesis GTPase A [bacterium ADurb.Bin363]HPZ07454.1 ribosome biogenesis GTPase YlqF [Candidatus Eremiobacteraeota bacterium]